MYDPAAIRVPTLLAHAEWDADLPSSMFYAYFQELVNTPYKRAVQIGEGTHTIMLEKNRMQMFREVQQFLDDKVSYRRIIADAREVAKRANACDLHHSLLTHVHEIDGLTDNRQMAVIDAAKTCN